MRPLKYSEHFILSDSIYQDDNGLPGVLVPDGSGTAQGGMIDAEFFPCIRVPFVCFEFWANLETPVELLPGTYWIEFSGESTGWGVVLDDVFVGPEGAFFRLNVMVPSVAVVPLLSQD